MNCANAMKKPVMPATAVECFPELARRGFRMNCRMRGPLGHTYVLGSYVKGNGFWVMNLTWPAKGVMTVRELAEKFTPEMEAAA